MTAAGCEFEGREVYLAGRVHRTKGEALLKVLSKKKKVRVHVCGDLCGGELVDELLWQKGQESGCLVRGLDDKPALGEADVGVVLGVADGGDVGEVPREKSALGPSKAKSKKGVKAEGAKSSAVKEFNALFGGTRGMKAIEVVKKRKRRHRGLNLSTRAKR